MDPVVQSLESNYTLLVIISILYTRMWSFDSTTLQRAKSITPIFHSVTGNLRSPLISKATRDKMFEKTDSSGDGELSLDEAKLVLTVLHKDSTLAPQLEKAFVASRRNFGNCSASSATIRARWGG